MPHASIYIYTRTRASGVEITFGNCPESDVLPPAKEFIFERDGEFFYRKIQEIFEDARKKEREREIASTIIAIYTVWHDVTGTCSSGVRILRNTFLNCPQDRRDYIFLLLSCRRACYHDERNERTG